MEQQLTIIVGAAILAGILWLVKTANDTQREVAILRAVLTGSDGDNGIAGDVRGLRVRSHQLAEDLHTVMGKASLLEQRVSRLEESRP